MFAHSKIIGTVLPWTVNAISSKDFDVLLLASVLANQIEIGQERQNTDPSAEIYFYIRNWVVTLTQHDNNKRESDEKRAEMTASEILLNGSVINVMEARLQVNLIA